jgi:hypothetical protein
MSTLCRADREWQKDGGAEKLESPFFCQIHFSAFLKGRVKGGRKISDYPKYFGNISEKQPFSENISDLIFGKGRGLGQTQSKWVKVRQTDLVRVRQLVAPQRQRQRKSHPTVDLYANCLL